MEIPFNGQYDKELFFKSVRLANQPPGNRRFVRTFMLVFVVAAIAVLVSRLIETGNILGNATYIALVMLIGAFLVRSYLQPQLVAQKMWNNPSVRRKLTGVVTKRGITYAGITISIFLWLPRQEIALSIFRTKFININSYTAMGW